MELVFECSLKVSLVVRLFGHCRQAFYQSKADFEEEKDHERKVIEAVKEIREEDPGIGGYKLWLMLIAMFAWVFRFGFFGLGNPGSGVWLFILSCIVYGVAFDFFNISGSLYVNENTDKGIRSSAQGLFMLMTNGLGASIGTWAAGRVVNHFVYNAASPSWPTAWYIFAAYSLVVAVAFMFLFKDPAKKSA